MPSCLWPSVFLGSLQQLWVDVSVRFPHAECYNESALKPGSLWDRVSWRNRSDVEQQCARWSLRRVGDSHLEVPFSRLSCEGASDRVSVRDRDRDRFFGRIASCVPSPLCCLCFVVASCVHILAVDVGMGRSRERTASSRQDSMCTAPGSAGAAMQPSQRAELPEQGDAPRLRPDRKVEHSNSQTGGRRAHRRDHRARWLRHASSSRSRMLLPCPTNASGSWRRK